MPMRRHMERLDRGVTLEELRELIADMDAALRALPPTAQVQPVHGCTHES